MNENIEMKNINDVGILASNTENYIIKSNKSEICKIAAIESCNSRVLVNDNIISNIGKYAFFVYNFGFIKAENNKIRQVDNAIANLQYKGSGDFIHRTINSCKSLCEIQTSLPFIFNDNSEFK